MTRTYEKDLDFKFAQSLYELSCGKAGQVYILRPGKSLLYSPGYVVTNEDLRSTIETVPCRGANVLTVAGSGDQALFYTLAGAKKVDTFDASFCAKAIMDIKVAAIQQGMSYDAFSTLLDDLHRGKNLTEHKNVAQILPNIPGDSAAFVKGMVGYRIFGNGFRPYNYKDEKINATEYAKLQSGEIKGFDFIWSNVSDLHTHLSCKYDIINLSNIFEWSPDLLVPSIQNLRKYLRPGGYIMVQSGEPISIHNNYPVFAKAQAIVSDWAKMWLNSKNSESVVILQRTR